MLAASVEIITEESGFSAMVEALHDVAFGPGRFARAAERLRENNVLSRSCSRLAVADGEVLATARIWPLSLVGGAGVDVVAPALLGPVAVDPRYRGAGIGRQVVAAAVEAALADEFTAIVTVGGHDYFSRFGFVRADNDLLLPAPVLRERLLVRQGVVLRGRLIPRRRKL